MEILLYFFGLLTIVTLEQVGRLASIEILHQIPERMFLDALLQPIKEHGNKLLDILLHHNINRLPKGFIRSTKRTGRKVLPISRLQIRHDPLNLMQKVIIDGFSLRVEGKLWLLVIVYALEEVSKGFVDVELLDHAVHVADVAQVFKARVPVAGFLVHVRRVDYFHVGDVLRNYGRGFLDHFSGDLFARFAYLYQQLEYLIT